jgi:transglutaminase-like putative cysteine protease
MRPQTGWTSVVLIALMLLTVAWSIQVAEYAPGLGILTPVVLGGVLMGTVLGAQRWMPATLAHGWGILVGLLATAILGTHTLVNFVTPGSLGSLSVLERVGLVRDWYIEWAMSTGAGRLAREDLVPFAFVLTMAVLMWLLSYICTWFVVRYATWWGAALPSAFALVFNLFQAPEERLVALGFFLACALLLAAQLHVVLQIDHWRRQQIAYSADISFEFLRDALVVVLIVVGLGWVAPSHPTGDRLQRLLRSFTGSTRAIEQRFNRLFPNLNYPVRGGGSAFGTRMPLGGSIALGNRAIFDAQVEGAIAPPRYFRMAVFDRYDGEGWQRTEGASVSGGAFRLDLARDALLTAPVTQTIRTFQPQTDQLFALPQPELFSVPVRAELAGSEDERDVMVVTSATALLVGNSYQAVSRQSVADVALLQAAGTEDPSWVRDRYLPLPPTVPARVRDLAVEVTRDTGNRFDAASRIEVFLRANIRYSETINDPPAGRDRVDWFLFDEQRGYCDYYSSAFVVLARLAGIPARVAAGYSVGEYVPQTRVYRQHEADAHTWPEVYFPGYGWIEFEPTASDTTIQRPGAGTGATPDGVDLIGTPTAPPDTQSPDPLRRPPPAPGTASRVGPHVALGRLGPLLGALALALVLGVGVATWWRRPLRGLSPAQGAFARLVRVAAWLGLGPRRSDTPNEYRDRLGAEIPDGRAEIATIVDAYVRERFGREGSQARSAPITAAWRRLRRALPRWAARQTRRRLRPGSG